MDDQQNHAAIILGSALEAAESYRQSIDDAEQAGDLEMAAFFRQLHRKEQALLDRARQLLAEPAFDQPPG